MEMVLYRIYRSQSSQSDLEFYMISGNCWWTSHPPPPPPLDIGELYIVMSHDFPKSLALEYRRFWGWWNIIYGSLRYKRINHENDHPTNPKHITDSSQTPLKVKAPVAMSLSGRIHVFWWSNIHWGHSRDGSKNWRLLSDVGKFIRYFSWGFEDW